MGREPQIEYDQTPAIGADCSFDIGGQAKMVVGFSRGSIDSRELQPNLLIRVNAGSLVAAREFFGCRFKTGSQDWRDALPASAPGAQEKHHVFAFEANRQEAKTGLQHECVKHRKQAVLAAARGRLFRERC
ncbi:MAG: hypothetical protein NW206_16005 [Hyphomonadaceae bacterium]|nr:hypothetical protein [Hyphomonadaceae bacterium]